MRNPITHKSYGIWNFRSYLTVSFRKELMISMLTTVQIQVPEAMKPYITNETADAALQRNALLLYPYILKRKISHGKAAEILGIHKLDLIELYGQLGLCYFDLTRDDLDKDLQTFIDLGLNGVLA